MKKIFSHIAMIAFPVLSLIAFLFKEYTLTIAVEDKVTKTTVTFLGMFKLNFLESSLFHKIVMLGAILLFCLAIAMITIGVYNLIRELMSKRSTPLLLSTILYSVFAFFCLVIFIFSLGIILDMKNNIDLPDDKFRRTYFAQLGAAPIILFIVAGLSMCWHFIFDYKIYKLHPNTEEANENVVPVRKLENNVSRKINYNMGNTWNCRCGHKGISSNFCPHCGAPKIQTWDCKCGRKRISSNFCPDCGSPRIKTWDCSCGRKKISSNFCPDCGNKKPE